MLLCVPILLNRADNVVRKSFGRDIICTCYNTASLPMYPIPSTIIDLIYIFIRCLDLKKKLLKINVSLVFVRI